MNLRSKVINIEFVKWAKILIKPYKDYVQVFPQDIEDAKIFRADVNLIGRFKHKKMMYPQ